MAREADLIDDTFASDWYVYQLKAFEALVRADEREETNRRANASWTLMCEKMVATEREACAKVCEDDSLSSQYGERSKYRELLASAIRARGNT
jgi:hypothetical protein